MKQRLFSKSLLIAKSLWDRRIGRVTGFFNAPELALDQLSFRPKISKIIELLLYLAHVRPGADKYQAVKFFYLADREHLLRYGRPITNEYYYALDYGPVASVALDVLNGSFWPLRQAQIEELPFDLEKGRTKDGYETTFIKRPSREIRRDLFSKSDLKVFEEIVAKYRDASFKELYNLTHDHEAYKKAWNSRPKGSRRAQMKYEEMVEDKDARERLIEHLAPIANHI